MARPEVVRCRDVSELGRNAAEQFAVLAGAAVARSGRFAVALSGGSTPAVAYSLLASPEYRERVDWARVHLFWGDERCVPPDRPESNFRMVQQTLLAKAPIPPQNIHRMMGERDPAEAAGAYQAELKSFFGLARGGWPRFDLIFLGVGEDGHTASLFPGTAVLDETEHWVAAVYVERLQSYRLTLTLPVINAAAQVSFLVTGENKSAIVKNVLGSSRSFDYPAGRVRPSNGQLTWFITQDAAGELSLHDSSRGR